MQIIVNGEALAESDIRAETAALRVALEAEAKDLAFEDRIRLRAEAILALIERALMSQEARRLKLAGAEGLIGYWGRHVKAASSDELRDYYDAHAEQFRRPEIAHASHFVKNTEGADVARNRRMLDEIRARVVAGEDFAGLAAAHSDCPERGGDLGFFARGVMVEEFDAVVFAAPLHEVTPVFQTRFGLHIAIIHERRPEGIPSPGEAAPQIAEAIYRGKLDREVGIRLAALRKRARIEEIR